MNTTPLPQNEFGGEDDGFLRPAQLPVTLKVSNSESNKG